MDKKQPALPHGIASSYVIVRFALRLILLTTFAALGAQLFATTLAQLLALAAIFCAATAAVRRELMFGPVLTHWDEALAYAITGHLIFGLS